MEREGLVTVLETRRLRLRRVSVADAEFIFTLYNDPSFVRFVGDRGLKQLADADAYIRKRFLPYYDQGGLGPYVVELGDAELSIGVCTLFKRDWLEDVDLGFAFLPEYRSQGFAFEAAHAMAEHARLSLGMTRLLAIVSEDNAPSERLLAKLGFKTAGKVLPPGDPSPINLFALDLMSLPGIVQ
jgi:RimJ/RimL family protein N-acetyltransferase